MTTIALAFSIQLRMLAKTFLFFSVCITYTSQAAVKTVCDYYPGAMGLWIWFVSLHLGGSCLPAKSITDMFREKMITENRGIFSGGGKY